MVYLQSPLWEKVAQLNSCSARNVKSQAIRAKPKWGCQIRIKGCHIHAETVQMTRIFPLQKQDFKGAYKVASEAFPELTSIARSASFWRFTAVVGTSGCGGRTEIMVVGSGISMGFKIIGKVTLSSLSFKGDLKLEFVCSRKLVIWTTQTSPQALSPSSLENSPKFDFEAMKMVSLADQRLTSVFTV